MSHPLAVLNRNPWIIALAMALALTGWMASGQLGHAETTPEDPVSTSANHQPVAPPVSVQVMASQAETLPEEIIIHGFTAPARSVTLRAETTGTVLEVGAKRGQLVRKGQLISRLDMRSRQARLNQAKALLTQQQLDYKAQKPLANKGYRTASQLAQTFAALQAAKAELRNAELDISKVRINAPFAGVLEQRQVERGTYVRPGDEVARIVELDPLIFSGQVAEYKRLRLKVGDSATIQIDGKMLDGQVRFIASESHPQTRIFAIEVQLDNPNGHIPAGVSATATVVSGQKLGHRIPLSTISLADSGELVVKVVDQDNIADVITIDVLKSNTEFAWVGGLPNSTRIITTGHGFIMAGQTVTIAKPSSEKKTSVATGGDPITQKQTDTPSPKQDNNGQ